MVPNLEKLVEVKILIRSVLKCYNDCPFVKSGTIMLNYYFYSDFETFTRMAVLNFCLKIKVCNKASKNLNQILLIQL